MPAFRNLLIVEPNQLFRDGLRELLRESSFNVTGKVRTASEAFHDVEVAPDLVVWGPAASAHIAAEIACVRSHYEATHPIRFVLLADLSNVSWLRRLVASGVDAVLSQDISSAVLHRSLDLVMLGQQLFPAVMIHAAAESPPALQAELIRFPMPAGHRPLPRDVERPGHAVLSSRDDQILRCLMHGASNKTIAYELSITEDAVKAYIKGLLRRIQARNRTQAAIWAMTHLLTPGGERVTPVGPPPARLTQTADRVAQGPRR